MPKTKGQGQSKDATEWKERGIAAAIGINLKIFRSKFGTNKKAVYQHFDLNSGSGMNAQIGCIGSPLAFTQSIREIGVERYRGYFVDIDHKAINNLSRYESMNNDSCFLFHGDNRTLIQAIPNLIALTERPQWAVGSVLIDPNGSDIPIKELAWLSRKCPKLDFIINWNSTIFKRLKGNHGKLEDLIAAIHKKHWLIRKPTSIHQWTLLIGRNVRVDEHKTIGFHHLDTDIGRHIFNRCNLTKTEYLETIDQGELF